MSILRTFRRTLHTRYKRFALHSHTEGLTLVEVLTAAAIVAIGFVGVFAINKRNLHVMRASRESATASQVLQQRAEQLRIADFSTVATSSGLTGLMQTGTDSEDEIADSSAFREVVTLETLSGSSSVISAVRTRNSATTLASGDLSGEQQLKATLRVEWKADFSGARGLQSREFVTYLAPKGVRATTVPSAGQTPGPVATATAALPTPAATPSATATPEEDPEEPEPDPSATPEPTPTIPPTPTPTPTPSNPAVCKHGRPWPHCGKP
jgi:Tfp pilus assembly protein PilV